MKTTKTLLLTFALVMIYTFGNCQTVSPELKKALDRAEMAKKIASETNQPEDWQEVIAEFKKAEQIDKQHGYTLYNLGLAYEKFGDFDNAIVYYKKYLIVEPNSKIAADVSTNINQIEYLRDRTKKQTITSVNMLGLWKSVEVNQFSGTPLWMFRIDKFNEDIRISVLPKSIKYNSRFTYPTAISLLHKNRLNFLFTTDANINPQEEINKLSNVLYAGESVKSVIDPFLPSYFGAAASIVSVIPTKKARNEQSAYIFNIDVSDSTKMTGKCNVKEYVAVAGQSPKTILDEVEEYSFIKIRQSEYNNIKIKYKKRKSPFSACILSTITPIGGGQIYNKQYTKAAILGIGQIGLLIAGLSSNNVTYYKYYDYSRQESRINGYGYSFIIASAALHLFSAIDATISASKINRNYDFNTNHKLKKNKDISLKINPSLFQNSYAYDSKTIIGFTLALNYN